MQIGCLGVCGGELLLQVVLVVLLVDVLLRVLHWHGIRGHTPTARLHRQTTTERIRHCCVCGLWKELKGKRKEDKEGWKPISVCCHSVCCPHSLLSFLYH